MVFPSLKQGIIIEIFLSNVILIAIEPIIIIASFFRKIFLIDFFEI